MPHRTRINAQRHRNIHKQAGAELCQAQKGLVGFEIEFEFRKFYGKKRLG